MGAPSLCPERELRLRVGCPDRARPVNAKANAKERERDTRPARTERSGVKRNPLFLPTSHHCSLHFTSPIPSITPPPSLPFPSLRLPQSPSLLRKKHQLHRRRSPPPPLRRGRGLAPLLRAQATSARSWRLLGN
jgi:hypothetical protein